MNITPRQKLFLNFLANELAKEVPAALTKEDASNVIQRWLDESGREDELQEKWSNHKARYYLDDIEFESLVFELDEWREFHDLKKLSPSIIRKSINGLGGREPDEDSSEWKDRILTYISRKNPDLVKSRSKKTIEKEKPKSNSTLGCGFICLMLGMLMLFFIMSRE